MTNGLSHPYQLDESILIFQPGAIDRSVAMSLGNQEALRSILSSGTSFREDSAMKYFYGHSSSSADSRRAFVS